MPRFALVACLLALVVAPAADAATYAPAPGHLLNGVAGGYSVSDYVARTGAAPEVVQSFVAYNGSTNWAFDLADSAQVCDCNGVCKGDIAAAVRTGGCATAREVMALTRAGTSTPQTTTMHAARVQKPPPVRVRTSTRQPDSPLARGTSTGSRFRSCGSPAIRAAAR